MQYIGANGQQLEKPEVAYFTIQNDVNSKDKALPSPQTGVQGLEVADYIPNAEKVKATSLTVIAVGANADQQSPYHFRSINGLLRRLPVGWAANTTTSWNQQLPNEQSDPIGYMNNRLYQWMIMAAGTVAAKTRALDVTKMKSEDTEFIYGPDMNNLTKETTTRFSVPYTV